MSVGDAIRAGGGGVSGGTDGGCCVVWCELWW